MIVPSRIADIQHLGLLEQAGHVALFRLRAALGSSATTIYQIASDGHALSESDVVKVITSQTIPAALNGIREGDVLKLEARSADQEQLPHIQGQLRFREAGGPEGSYPQWPEVERYGADWGVRPVALEAKDEVLIAQAAAVQRSIEDYWLSCGYSMGISFNDSDGPLAERARELGVIACFTLGPEGRVISIWINQ